MLSREEVEARLQGFTVDPVNPWLSVLYVHTPDTEHEALETALVLYKALERRKRPGIRVSKPTKGESDGMA